MNKHYCLGKNELEYNKSILKWLLKKLIFEKRVIEITAINEDLSKNLGEIINNIDDVFQ